jgi:hypothetical protein
MDFQAMGADGETQYWYDIVGWYQSKQRWRNHLVFLIIITFIVLLCINALH